MKRMQFIAAGLTLAAAIGLGASPSYAKQPSVNDPNPHSGVMSGWDQQQSVETTAQQVPQVGQVGIGVVERHHYVNSPGCVFRCNSVHDTYYFTESRLTATYVDVFQRWIAQGSDGSWYSFAAGSNNGTRLSGKPTADQGLRSTVIDSNDRRSVRSVVASGNQLLATFGYTHSLTLYDITYSTQELVPTTYVQLDSGPAYLAWIGRTEYMVRPYSNQAVALASMPIVKQGRAYSPNYGDSTSSVELVDINGIDMTLRYTYHHDDTYVTDEYYVDRVKQAQYNQNLNLWVVNIDGADYAVAFAGDDTNSWNGTVVHAPQRFGRPQFSVQGTGGAVVPGRPVDHPSSSGNSGCIQGVNCPADAPAHGNDCIQGVNCPPDAAPPAPRGNDCIKGVTC